MFPFFGSSSTPPASQSNFYSNSNEVQYRETAIRDRGAKAMGVNTTEQDILQKMMAAQDKMDAAKKAHETKKGPSFADLHNTIGVPILRDRKKQGLPPLHSPVASSMSQESVFAGANSQAAASPFSSANPAEGRGEAQGQMRHPQLQRTRNVLQSGAESPTSRNKRNASIFNNVDINSDSDIFNFNELRGFPSK